MATRPRCPLAGRGGRSRGGLRGGSAAQPTQVVLSSYSHLSSPRLHLAMASYLRSWLSSQLSPAESIPTIPRAPSILHSPPGAFVTDEEDETETVRGDSPNTSIVVKEVDDDDVPPAFPALNSAQRAGNGTHAGSMSPPPPPIPRILTDSGPNLLVPPPQAGLSSRRPGVTPSLSSLVVPSVGGSLAPPLTTTKAPAKKSRKVALLPGHGPLDWANLKKSGENLRVRTLSYTLSVLAEIRSRE